MRTPFARRRVMAFAIIAASVAFVGCGPSPWSAEPGDATPSPTVSVPPPVPNDLSSGSTERELTAGAVSAQVDYWSTLSMDQWTAGAVKPISISLLTTVTPDDGQKVYLQKASMIATPANADETFAPLEAQLDAASVTPGYLVLSPYSYSQTFHVGPVDEAATYVTVQFTYDFLVQTTPTSKEYAKQTATDTLTVAIAAD
ncbi:hypothetical protein [Microbacterium alcoholitolerans]|uniref:hypothetical protein n=1 Tax=unclassified Microbacterium TaxID=2609290 RepID=UPI003D17F337